MGKLVSGPGGIETVGGQAGVESLPEVLHFIEDFEDLCLQGDHDLSVCNRDTQVDLQVGVVPAPVATMMMRSDVAPPPPHRGSRTGRFSWSVARYPELFAKRSGGDGVEMAEGLVHQ